MKLFLIHLGVFAVGISLGSWLSHRDDKHMPKPDAWGNTTMESFIGQITILTNKDGTFQTTRIFGQPPKVEMNPPITNWHEANYQRIISYTRLEGAYQGIVQYRQAIGAAK